MALTTAQFELLKTHWPRVIQTIYPAIAEIPDGGGDTIASKLSTWRDAVYTKPAASAIEDALLNVVLPAVAAAQQNEAARETNLSDVLTRLNASGLADKTPAEIYTAMQNQIDGWGSLAAAKANMREWFPLMAAAIMWLVRRN